MSLNPTLFRGSFIEEGDLLSLIVGTRVAKHRAKGALMPLEIALAVKGLGGLTLTRESFTLVDEQGVRYPVVGPDELRRARGYGDPDRRLGDILDPARTRFSPYSRIRSNFSPGFRDSLDLPRLYLPRANWIHDVLYFPRPEGGVRGKSFELHLVTPELNDPILIKFKVD